MKCLATVALALGLGMPLSLKACDAAPWLILEIEAGEIAGNEVAEWVEVDQEGCVTTGYAVFDRRAGLYERRLEADERSELEALLDRSGIRRFDPSRARDAMQAAEIAEVKAGGQRVLVSVSDADHVRLELHEGKRRQQITWLAPEIEASNRKGGDVLQPLVEVVGALRAVGADPRKQKVGSASP